MSHSLKIAFADDHPTMLRGLVSVFADDDAFDVVATATTADEALKLVVDRAPEVIFFDLSMPGDVFGAIKTIANAHSATKVIIYTAFSSTESALKALDMGAMGFVLKGSPLSELTDAVRSAVAGELYVSRQFASNVFGGLRERARRTEISNAVRLNLREKQIVAHLLEARTNKEIARHLNLSEKTSKHYMSSLMLKLKARNRVEVAVAARRHADAQDNVAGGALNS